MITEDQHEQLAIQWFQETGWTYVPAAVIAPEGVAAEREDFRAVVLKGRLAEAVRRLNPKLPESAVEEVRRRVAMPGRVLHGVTKPVHRMGRPFRAWESVCDGTQGVALGCRMVPRWGGRSAQLRPSGARRRKR
jgi:hypothetical protein